MSLPPRLLMPELLPDPADIPRLRAAARRRRAAQSGTLGVLVAIALAISSNGGSSAGLRQVEPVATLSSSPTATAPTAEQPRVRPGVPSGPGGSDTAPPSPASTSQGSAAAGPESSGATEHVPVQTDFHVRSLVVPDPGGPCEHRHRVPMTDINFGAFEACTRVAWPERTPQRAGADLSLSYCVTLGTARGSFDAPRFEIGGIPGISWRYEDQGGMHSRTLVLPAGQCLVWTVFWAGAGRLESGGPAWFPRDTHDVTVDAAPPAAYDGGERIGAGRLLTYGSITVA